MNEKELRELDAWIAEHVMGWKRIGRSSGKYRACFRTQSGGEFYTGRERMPIAYECDHPENEMFAPSKDPAAAMQVLEKCAEKMTNGIVAIASPMGNQSVASTIPKTTQGWVVGMIGRPSNFDVEAETLTLAICRFAKKLFTQ